MIAEQGDELGARLNLQDKLQHTARVWSTALHTPQVACAGAGDAVTALAFHQFFEGVTLGARLSSQAERVASESERPRITP
jgi:hypothetical protein